MSDYFDILGTPIKFEDIKSFRIVQREYIYTPSYKEVRYEQKKFLKTETRTGYEFNTMVPFAAIIDESDRRGVFGNLKGRTPRESMGLEIVGDIRESIGNKFNVKAIKGKKYRCINNSDREFSVYLDEVPFKVQYMDGRIADVQCNDPLYLYLMGASGPAINVVPALQIIADEKYLFWGNGIQMESISLEHEYQRLKEEMEQYRAEKSAKKRLFGKGSAEKIEGKATKELSGFPKLKLPNLKKKEAKDES